MARKKKRRILIDILTIFTSLFIFTDIVVTYYSYHSSSKAILEIGNELVERTNQSVIDKLNEFLDPTPFIKMSSYYLKDQTLDLSAMQSLSGYMHVILQSYPELNSAYLADNHGNMFMESRVSNNIAYKRLIPFINVNAIPENTRYISEMIHTTPKQTLVDLLYKDSNGITLKTEKNKVIHYDARQRPWFLGAKNLRDHNWLGVYEFFGAKKQGITVASALWSNNQLAGIVAADLSVDTLSNELKKFSVHNQGTLLIINNKGEVISSKNDAITLKITEKLPHVNELNNAVISEAYAEHLQNHSNSFTFTVTNNKYIAHFTPYAFTSTESWEIVRILPLDVFVGTLKNANHHTMLFSIAMLALGLLLIIYSAHKISRPIMRLAKETKNIMKLNFKHSSLITHVYEVQVMIDALNATKSALSSFSKYVPKTLVEQLLQTKMIAELGGTKKIFP